MHIQLKQNTRGGWRFDVVAGNGQVILASKPYTRKRNADEAIALVQRDIANCAIKVDA